ncbi:MAG: murein L,D-transpeptidase [Comamonadaceae bacterium CG_4_9_14_3_um_filter_60_33]|nr:MAG: murein L,D-transpeptidase [Comamonadaceae bacterium CG2_30_59_20]PIY29730.1 MAG: murein L,D-transpeptidase [Comamonadaceae bacterium CG_4_10_14_3_um_filter_60_42]PJB44884.1 MAG: murein L,D-transpeptidase [Comamonadaceae bacterium CG_4_9_14_3_um_filter_60_33]
MKMPSVLAVRIALAASTSPMAAQLAGPDSFSEIEQVRPVTTKTKGSAVLRAQVLLDRAYFPSGEIDAIYGQNLRNAIRGYQKTNGLQATGNIDVPTWAVLNTDTAPILVTYTILDADVAGPFIPIPTEWPDKAKMKALGYTSAKEALGEKFHVSPKLLARLNPGKDFGRAGEEIVVPNVTANPDLPKAVKIIVDKSDRTLSLADADGKITAQFPVTTGSKYDPLPLGNWKVKGVARNPVFHYNPKLFWDADPGDTKAKIAAGPNNPVGVVWIDLTKEHYGIHGTPEPSTIGKTQSHGCIRLTNWDASAVAQSVVTGVDVLLQE